MPLALLNSLPEGAVISGYNVVDSTVNPDATVTFVDPLRANTTQNAVTRAGDRRVYVKTMYSVGKMTMVQGNL